MLGKVCTKCDKAAMMTGSHAWSGVVYPLRGPLEKAAGRRLARFGPLTGWTVDLTAKLPMVRLAQPYPSCHPCAQFSV